MTDEEAMRQLALDLGFVPVVPPRTSRLFPWNYNKLLYRRRNEIERLFRRLKGFRRIFSRFDKLDVMFTGFISSSKSSVSVDTPPACPAQWFVLGKTAE